MKKSGKRTAAVALATVLAMGMLTGCGEKKLDSSAVAATVNGQEIQLGLVSLLARQQQAQTEAMYQSFMGGQAGSIWDDEAEEGKTYGEQAVEGAAEQIELMYLLKEKAPEYQVEVTEEDQEAIAQAAADFMKANSEEVVEELAVTEEQVKTYLELRTYQDRMYKAIIAEADTNVDEKEAQQSAFTYVLVSTGEDMEEEEQDKKKEQAQEILDKVKADPSADMDEIAKEIDETYSDTTGTFSTNLAEEGEDEDVTASTYPEEVLTALRTLEDGQVYEELVETDNGFYVLRMDQVFDEDATESKKESIIAERKTELYEETTEKWMDEAEIKTEKKVLETLKITDSHKFTIQMPTTEEPEAEVTEAPEVTEEPEAEVTEAPEVTEEPEAEVTEAPEVTEEPEEETAE